jgi:hypothetical protein
VYRPAYNRTPGRPAYYVEGPLYHDLGKAKAWVEGACSYAGWDDVKAKLVAWNDADHQLGSGYMYGTQAIVYGIIDEFEVGD